MNLNNKLKVSFYVFILIFAGVVLYMACNKSNQATMPTSLHTSFKGEYRQGDGQWQPLDENTEISALEGDVVIRGCFEHQLKEGWLINFYLKHIGMRIYINGELQHEVRIYNGRFYEEMCGEMWQPYRIPNLSPDDVFEIELINPHKYGNPDAFNCFLDSFYFGEFEHVQNHIKTESDLAQLVGIVMMVIAIALIGVSVGYVLLDIPCSKKLFDVGFIALFMGWYIFLDTQDIYIRSNLIVFNTYAKQLSIMFASLGMIISIRDIVSDGRAKIADILIALLAGVNTVLLAITFFGETFMYDTLAYWAVAQVIVTIPAVILLAMEMLHNKDGNNVIRLAHIGLAGVLVLEIVNGYLGLWKSGSVIKLLFGILLAIYIIGAVKFMAVNYKAAMKAKMLEEEFERSRIVLAMSQIHPHFIHNSLAAIRSLCVENPKDAIETIDNFSGFLRGSLETMIKDQCVSFDREMELVDNYLYLEQKRFEGKIIVEKNIEVESFMIPPMTIQPIVENSVRHGIRNRNTPGVVAISTFEKKDEYVVEIKDNGVGFDADAVMNDGKIHVGFDNVKKRLAMMCNGRMEYDSVVGVGTCVRIYIPKK